MLHLIMLSGLQGTGKSTLAKRLASELNYPLFAKDHLEAVLYTQQITKSDSVASYHQMFALAELHLSLGMSCILDAVFPRVGFRQRVGQIAESHQAHHIIIHTYCSDLTLHRHRLESRVSTVPWKRISWEQVLKTQSFYEAWKPNQALFVDSVNPLETNFEKTLQYIRDF